MPLDINPQSASRHTRLERFLLPTQRVSDSPPIFLTIAECVDPLRLSERSVYGMAREGKLSGAAKVG